MAENAELMEALAEATGKMQESEGFRSRFAKLIENYMDGMGSEAEIADVIELAELTGDGYED